MKMKLTGEQLVVLRESGAEGPKNLKDADFSDSRGWIYDREYGFFHVSACWHVAAMELLLAFHNDCKNEKEVANKLKFRRGSGRGADVFLETVSGTCYMSSVSNFVQAGSKKNLTPSEKKFFGKIEYLDEVCQC